MISYVFLVKIQKKIQKKIDIFEFVNTCPLLMNSIINIINRNRQLELWDNRTNLRPRLSQSEIEIVENSD